MAWPALPREVTLGVLLVLAQVLYSQVYPFLAGQVTHSSVDLWSSWARSSPPSLASDSTPLSDSSDGTSRDSGVGAAPTPSAEYFAESTAARHRRQGTSSFGFSVPEPPKFYIGEMVRDRILFVRGIIIGWDATCQAPDDWRKKRLSGNDHWASQPHYLLLVDIRDVAHLEELPVPPAAAPGGAEPSWSDFVNLGRAVSNVSMPLYSPQATLERLGQAAGPLMSPLLPAYFVLFDASAEVYVPHPRIARRYPDDVDGHYRALVEAADGAEEQ